MATTTEEAEVSEAGSARDAASHWLCVFPQLAVRDVSAAQRYYRDVLGCEIRWTWEDSYGAVENGNVELFFARDEDPTRSVICVVVDDADRVYAQCRAHGADIVDDLGSKPHRMREFTVRDRDGNLIRIGHAEGSLEGVPGFSIGERPEGHS
jgi:catechol 2,3-dioxygenase-like lactoylglutathione lyase family enzyme